MITLIKMDYEASRAFEKLSRDAYEEIRVAVPQLNMPEWAEPFKWDKAAAKAGERHRVFCASLADVFEDRPRHPHPHQPRQDWPEDSENRPHVYFGGQKYLIDQSTDGQLLAKHGVQYTVCNYKSTYNAGTIPTPQGEQTLHVHIPNIGLLMIDEVMVLENSCTEVLQSELNAGWRIVAVCPPNGARRPDYILGRSGKGSHASN